MALSFETVVLGMDGFNGMRRELKSVLMQAARDLARDPAINDIANPLTHTSAHVEDADILDAVINYGGGGNGRLTVRRSADGIQFVVAIGSLTKAICFAPWRFCGMENVGDGVLYAEPAQGLVMPIWECRNDILDSLAGLSPVFRHNLEFFQSVAVAMSPTGGAHA